MSESTHRSVCRLVNQLLCFFYAIILILVVGLCLQFVEFEGDADYIEISVSPSDIYLQNYDVSTLGDSEEDELIRQGYSIFVNTPEHMGPQNGDSTRVYAGNNLSCNNCHLLAGTKAYAAPLIGVISRFPQYRGRENKMGTIEERINGCMERSMNGVMMSETAPEMNALVAYLKWLDRFAPDDGMVEGQGFVKLAIPERAVDLEHGREIFFTICSECHGYDGQGSLKKNSLVYEYPPLWGGNSFNNGAGMTRVITAARFIKGNMPYGVTYMNPRLTDEEAYDVAGYINQQARPVKTNLAADFPDLLKKPVSTPYPPYMDSFSEEQHQLGPFQPIMAYYLKKYDIRKTK